MKTAISRRNQLFRQEKCIP